MLSFGKTVTETVLSHVGFVSWCCRNWRPKIRPVAVRDVSQNQSKGGCETTSNSKIFDFPYMAPRPLGTKRVNVQFFSVGRPGLDPGTLGLKGTVRLLLCVEPVEDSLCFKGNGVVSCRSGLAVLQKYEA